MNKKGIREMKLIPPIPTNPNTTLVEGAKLGLRLVMLRWGKVEGEGG